MEQICAKELCTACAACMNVCAHGAIMMEETSPCGYVYPKIDASICVDCGLCSKTCPINNPLSLHTPIKAYAATSRNLNDLMTSSSGGASSVMVNYILSQGGVVYGCVQNNYKDIAHRRIAKFEDAYKLKNSKYVQSNIGYIYKDVKKDLQSGIPVLFTGTPCQIAGLRRFLRKEYDNLFLVDLVCHGVPSQHLLIEDVENILRRNGIKGDGYKVLFRKKTPQNASENLKYGVFLHDGDTELLLPDKDIAFLYNNYITAFMSGIILRDNCFSCPYAQGDRSSDITIADFWGLGKSIVSKERGVSLIMTNTEKGERLVKSISSFCVIEERNVDEAIKGNGQLQSPSSRPLERNLFLSTYPQGSDLAYTSTLKNYKKAYVRRMRKMKVIHALLRMLNKNKALYNLLRRMYKFIKR